MKLLIKIKYLIFWLVVYSVLYAYLQTCCEYHFYFIEQNQLFQNTWFYVAEHLSQPGGLALICSEFLVQFFLLPYAGAAITAALLTIAGGLTFLLVKRIAPKADCLALCLLPVVTLLFMHFNFNYLPYGTVAYLLTLLVLYAVVHIQGFTVRFIAHLLSVMLLFCLAGPVFMLYALIATVYELLFQSPRRYLVILLLGEGVLIGALSVYFAINGEYRLAFLPDGYYHTKLIPHSVIYYSWCSLLLIVLSAYFLQNRKPVSRKRLLVETSFFLIAVAALLHWGITTFSNKQAEIVKRLDYYSRTEQWDQILQHCQGSLSNYLHICHVNLALMQKGELGDKMFSYDQRGPEGMVINWNKTTSVSVLLSDIYFAMNLVAPAQEMAFEAYISVIGEGNPRILKRLVQTNLIYGAYPVAEKYISILENTVCYRDWAKAHRRFLYRDDEVANDPLLGAKQRLLMPVSTLSLLKGIDIELQHLAENNPSDHTSIVYAGALYLLLKDVQAFQSLIEQYFGTSALPSLPVPFQEAVILLAENTPAYWERFRIANEVVQRFSEYKKQVLAGSRKGNANALPGSLLRSFGNTYWFYYMFK
ncbi:hypothetical protein EZS27_010135 [termite gut metagenome]|uniref:Transmembrane protein n=1 Tax=termite gut metagenome TaxID=433724 RepID=A0A5J4SA39_9ZZZZ